jgi:hypothetical protein
MRMRRIALSGKEWRQARTTNIVIVKKGHKHVLPCRE